MLKKFLSYATAIFAVAVLLMPKAGAAGVGNLSAHSAILLDGMTGRVLYEKNAHEKSLIASTTKIMTGLLISQQCNPDSGVLIRKEAVGIEGSSLYLKEGEQLTVKELLYGLMLHSGNDAAVALALFCDGSVESFVGRMNEKAKSLGLTATHFANPHGLDSEENYSTAYDLAKLTAYALQNDIFRTVCATKQISIPGRTLTNHNKLLWRYPGAVGVKTGYTKAAGRILVSAAERNGRQLIAVTINAPKDWADHEKLLDYGFEAFTSTRVFQDGELVATLPILSGKQETVDVIVPDSFSCPLGQGESLVIRLHLPRFVYAPVEKGTLAGYAEVLTDGHSLAKIPLYFKDSVDPQHSKKGVKFRILPGG